ncbi:MAG: nickel-dependent lactate racemase family protein [Candidatus Alkanophagales archaeon]
MPSFKLPYGTGVLEFEMEAVALDGGRSPAGAGRGTPRHDVIRSAMSNPIGTKRLRDLRVAGAREVVIVVDDHTRATPTELMLDAIMEELKLNAGVRTTDVRVLVACGTHEPPAEGELRRILGKYYDLYRDGELEVELHDCDDAERLVRLGETSRGTPVLINRSYVDAGLRILTGDITLHYYAGFGGGRKSIIPGIAGRESIRRNHALLVDERAATANLEGNPVHLDMCEFASFAPPHFTLNVVADADGALVDAYAGELNAVFERGVAAARKIFERHVGGGFDALIVSAGGFPKDRNLYQASKAIEHCYRAIKPGGKLILVARCDEGVGDEHFERWMGFDETELERAIRENFVLGGHKAFYLRRAMRRVNISIVSELDACKLEEWGIGAYSSLEEALKEEVKEGDKVGVVRRGMDVLLVPLRGEG